MERPQVQRFGVRHVAQRSRPQGYGKLLKKLFGVRMHRAGGEYPGLGLVHHALLPLVHHVVSHVVLGLGQHLEHIPFGDGGKHGFRGKRLQQRRGAEGVAVARVRTGGELNAAHHQRQGGLGREAGVFAGIHEVVAAVLGDELHAVALTMPMLAEEEEPSAFRLKSWSPWRLRLHPDPG